MKKDILDIDGKKKGTMELPKCFESEIRNDLIKRAYESEISTLRPKYGPFYLAGELSSSSGKVKHARSGYRAHYGKGVSRSPKKTMSRRGDRRFWVGAFVPSARGGRAAHPPKPWKNTEKLMNKKEMEKALFSTISAAANNSIIVEKKFEELKKTKDIINSVKKLIPTNTKNSLIVTAKDLKINFGNFISVKKLGVRNLAPSGQIRKNILWTENAIEELKK